MQSALRTSRRRSRRTASRPPPDRCRGRGCDVCSKPSPTRSPWPEKPTWVRATRLSRNLGASRHAAKTRKRRRTPWLDEPLERLGARCEAQRPPLPSALAIRIGSRRRDEGVCHLGGRVAASSSSPSPTIPSSLDPHAACTFRLRHGAPSVLTGSVGASCLSGLNYTRGIRSPRYRAFTARNRGRRGR
jgi:hypothetical protein